MNEKEPSPEQLLKMLDVQLQASRMQREKNAGNRTTFRVLAIALLLVLLLGALGLLMFLAQEMPRPPKKPAENPPAATQTR